MTIFDAVWFPRNIGKGKKTQVLKRIVIWVDLE